MFNSGAPAAMRSVSDNQYIELSPPTPELGTRQLQTIELSTCTQGLFKDKGVVGKMLQAFWER